MDFSSLLGGGGSGGGGAGSTGIGGSGKGASGAATIFGNNGGDDSSPAWITPVLILAGLAVLGAVMISILRK